MKLVGVVVLALSFIVVPVQAESASEVARSYFDVLKEKKYEDAAVFFDPAALGEFREMMGFVNEMPGEVQAQVYAAFFGPEATLESVAKLSDGDFFGSFLRAVMAQAETVGTINFDKVEILGEVAEGDDVVHLVTRNRVTLGETEMEAMEIVSFRKRGESWKMLMAGKIKGLPAQLEAAFGK